MSDIELSGYLMSPASSGTGGIAALLGGGSALLPFTVSTDANPASGLLTDLAAQPDLSVLESTLDGSSSAADPSSNESAASGSSIDIVDIASLLNPAPASAEGDTVELQSSVTPSVVQTPTNPEPALNTNARAAAHQMTLIGAAKLSLQVAQQMLLDPTISEIAVANSSPMNVWALFG